MPNGYTARSATLEDAPSIADLLNRSTRYAIGEDVITAERMRAELAAPGLELEHDARLVIAPDGAIRGQAFVIDHIAPHVRVQQLGTVDPEHRGRGIGSAILSWMMDRSRETLPKAPPGARVIASQGLYDAERNAAALLSSQGFSPVRHFWRMSIDLDCEPDQPIWPPGVTVAPFDPEQDLEAAYDAGRDAFRDHWGHVDGVPEEGLARFRHRIRSDPAFDPTLWFLARVGKRIVGICYAHPMIGADRTVGYITTLGVRRAWRRRGIALALLLHAFDALRQRGKRRAALHVDAASLTGATRLYEKAGMRTDQLSHLYEAELRPGRDLTTR